MNSYDFTFELREVRMHGVVFADNEKEAEEHLNVFFYGAIYEDKNLELRGVLPLIRPNHAGIRTLQGIRGSINEG